MSAGSWRKTPLPPGWGRLRMIVLARDRVCQWGLLHDEEGPCGQDATECDHMGDANDHRLEMLRGLCLSHHRRRSNLQSNVRHTLRKRPQDPHPGVIRGARDVHTEGEMLLCLLPHLSRSRSIGNLAPTRRHVRRAMAPARSTRTCVRSAMARAWCRRTGSRETGQLCRRVSYACSKEEA